MVATSARLRQDRRHSDATSAISYRLSAFGKNSHAPLAPQAPWHLRGPWHLAPWHQPWHPAPWHLGTLFLHPVVLRSLAALRRYPRDHAVWVHDVARLAVHAVRGV